MNSGTFFCLFVQNAGKWSGCDWATKFGANRLNLKGLRAAQVILLAGATSGSEGPDWRAAANWLAEVERDAKQAEAKAAKAAELAEGRKLAEALQLADQACAIERRYHTKLIWQPLRDEIAGALAEGERECNSGIRRTDL